MIGTTSCGIANIITIIYLLIASNNKRVFNRFATIKKHINITRIRLRASLQVGSKEMKWTFSTYEINDYVGKSTPESWKVKTPVELILIFAQLITIIKR